MHIPRRKINRILATVAENYMLTVEEIRSKSRQHRIVDARAAFIRLMSHEFDMSPRASVAALKKRQEMGPYYLKLSETLCEYLPWRTSYNECVYQTAKESDA
jgi:hypothetical protein